MPGVMAIADHIVDMGPGAGRAGGTIVFEGPFKRAQKERHADVTVKIPKGDITAVTGRRGQREERR